jgi:hypothetical protein
MLHLVDLLPWCLRGNHTIRPTTFYFAFWHKQIDLKSHEVYELGSVGDFALRKNSKTKKTINNIIDSLFYRKLIYNY